MCSFYLGPSHGRISLETWDDVRAAAEAGVLDESLWVELKQAIPSAAGANLELAKDLASLSVDGGVLVVGVADARGRAGKVVGTDLAGLADRITQIAAGRVTPPLPVSTHEIASPDSSDGLLVISVPASMSSPHMVDGRYWGRSDSGKRRLSDGEVAQLFATRRGRESATEEKLRALAQELDPLPREARERGHLYVMVAPAGGISMSPLAALAGVIAPQLILEALRGYSPRRWPSLESLMHTVPHPDGYAAATFGDPSSIDDEEDVLALLIGMAGEVQLASGSGTKMYAGRGAVQDQLVASPLYVIELLHTSLMLASHVASERIGYWGPWQAGILIDGLKGVLPVQAMYEMGHRRMVPFPRAEYLRMTSTTTDEMQQAPQQVVERLAADLMRGLGLSGRYLPYTNLEDLRSNG